MPKEDFDPEMADEIAAIGEHMHTLPSLTERLRGEGDHAAPGIEDCREAADRIDALEAALRDIADETVWAESEKDSSHFGSHLAAIQAIARRALESS